MSTFLISRCLVGFIVVLLLSGQSSAKGGGGFGQGENRYHPHYIESLPPEIRNTIIHQCGAPKATQAFARYADNLQKVVLRYEHFYCSAGGTFCDLRVPASGLCFFTRTLQTSAKLLRPGRGVNRSPRSR